MKITMEKESCCPDKSAIVATVVSGCERITTSTNNISRSSSNDNPSDSVMTATIITNWTAVYILVAISLIEVLKLMTISINAWPYLISMDHEVGLEFFGLAKAASTVAIIVSSLIAGHIANQIMDTKPPILFGFIFFIISALAYTNIAVLEISLRKWAYFLVDVCFGICAGSIMSLRAYLAMRTASEDRQRAFGLVYVAVNAAMITSPFIVIPFGKLFSDPPMALPWGSQLSLYTAPVYILAIISVLATALIGLFYDGRLIGGNGEEEEEGENALKLKQEKSSIKLLHMIKRPWSTRKINCSNNNDAEVRQPKKKNVSSITQIFVEGTPFDHSLAVADENMPKPNNGEELSKSRSNDTLIVAQQSAAADRPDWLAVACCFLVRFSIATYYVYLFAYAILKLSSAFTMDTFGWTGEQAASYSTLTQAGMGIMGVLISLGFSSTRFLTRFAAEERAFVLFSLTLSLAYFLLTFPWPFPWSARLPNCGQSMQQQYAWCENTPAINVYLYHIAMVFCMGLALPIIYQNLDVLCSRLLGQMKQGVFQTAFQATGEATSLIGPPLINFAYQNYGPLPIWSGYIAILVAANALWLLNYRRLVPKDVAAIKKIENSK